MHTSDKAHHRRELIRTRAALSPEQIEVARAAVCAAVLDRAETAAWTCVAAFRPLRTEPGSTELLTGLVDLGLRVLVPVMLEDRDLDWHEWDGAPSPSSLSPSSLSPSSLPPSGPGPSGPGPSGLGRDAIAAADAVLVPALAVAADGTRLGRGGGSYDRALPRVRDGVPIAALLFDDELVDVLPRQQWDVPVTAVVTPRGWRELGHTTPQ